MIGIGELLILAAGAAVAAAVVVIVVRAVTRPGSRKRPP
jgi:hypothetical protein